MRAYITWARRDELRMGMLDNHPVCRLAHTRLTIPIPHTPRPIEVDLQIYDSVIWIKQRGRFCLEGFDNIELHDAILHYRWSTLRDALPCARQYYADIILTAWVYYCRATGQILTLTKGSR